MVYKFAILEDVPRGELMTWHLSDLTASLIMSDESIGNNADHLTLHTVLGSSMHARAEFGTNQGA
jgi:hypothetical protein